MRRAPIRAPRAAKRHRPSFLPLEGRQLLSSGVLTYHDDNSRTGANTQETTLTPANVNASTFGKVGFESVDGKVDAQPLYVPNLSLFQRGTADVLYVATESDSVFAFDADNGAILWHDSPDEGIHALLGPGEVPVPATDFRCDQVAPTIGITSTPVIDRAAGAIYVVTMSKGNDNGLISYHQRIHKLDLVTGAEMVPPRSIDSTIRFPGKGPGGDGTSVVFDPKMYVERPALTLVNGVIYTGWASHCDMAPYTGWVIGFNSNDLSVASVLNIDPNGTPSASILGDGSGSSFWNSGAGFAADSQGNLYNISANGPFDPSAGDYGDAYLKFSTAGGLAVADYFAPSNQQQLANTDLDLGSSGLILLPDARDAQGQTIHLAVGSGKDGNIYLVNRDNLGKFNPAGNAIRQEIPSALGGSEFGSPAYFNGKVYFGAVGSRIKAFTFSGGLLSAAGNSQSPGTFPYPGTSPTVSANGTSDGIVWAAENGPTAALHAYDANNLAVELYNSNQAPGGRDHFGPGNKFITPTVADGRVYVGTTNGVAVFGLLPPAAPPPVVPTPPPPVVPTPPPTVLVPAFASPAPVVGGIDLLAAVGTSPTFGASLIYTWSTVAAPPGAPTPSFSANGTAAAGLVSVGIAAPGSYTFRVTIADPAGRSVASDVSIVAGLPIPTVLIRASASSTPRVGSPALLSAFGSDPGFGEPALSYSWTAIGAPRGASRPTFGPNGTNASKVISVAFSRPGAYTFRVTIANPFAEAVSSDVTVVVGPRARHPARNPRRGKG